MSTGRDQGAGGQPTEEELRAAYEEEIKKIRVEHVLLEHVVTLVNLGMRRTGLAPGTESERDPAQVGLAIEAVRAVLGLIEQIAPEQVKPIRDALSQLQLAYVRIGGSVDADPGGPPTGEAPATGEAPSTGETLASEGAASGSSGPDSGGGPRDPEGQGPAQRSGRLWVPGS